jgi:hypothetical protein
MGSSFPFVVDGNPSSGQEEVNSEKETVRRKKGKVERSQNYLQRLSAGPSSENPTIF